MRLSDLCVLQGGSSVLTGLPSALEHQGLRFTWLAHVHAVTIKWAICVANFSTRRRTEGISLLLAKRSTARYIGLDASERPIVTTSRASSGVRGSDFSGRRGRPTYRLTARLRNTVRREQMSGGRAICVGSEAKPCRGINFFFGEDHEYSRKQIPTWSLLWF